jgi:hypothetical protein
MLRFMFRACPRCRGDLSRASEAPDDKWECLQCGRNWPASGFATGMAVQAADQIAPSPSAVRAA